MKLRFAPKPISEQPSPVRGFAVGVLSYMALGPRCAPDARRIDCDAGDPVRENGVTFATRP